MKKKPKVTVLTGGMVIKGNVIKNGLDTSRFVNLIICFKKPENMKIDGFQFLSNLFYIHEITFSEAIGILIHKFNYKPEDAKQIVKDWKSALQTKEIQRDEDSKKYENIVEDTNKEVVKQKGENYKIGEPDIIIISGFKKENINIVHVKDKGFEETCKNLDIQVIPTQKKDIEKENQIKKKLNRI